MVILLDLKFRPVDFEIKKVAMIFIQKNATKTVRDLYQWICMITRLNPILPGGGGGGVKYASLLFFLHHPKTAQGIKLKLSDFKDTLLRHILQVKPVR